MSQVGGNAAGKLGLMHVIFVGFSRQILLQVISIPLICSAPPKMGANMPLSTHLIEALSVLTASAIVPNGDAVKQEALRNEPQHSFRAIGYGDIGKVYVRLQR